MKHFWLNKKDENKKLILFLSGWGMNQTPFEHLNCGTFDVLILFNYTDLNFDFSKFDLAKYEEKYLICWSMGVFVSGYFREIFADFNKKIAINGTLKMIDDLYGIQKKIYDITIKLFSEKTRQKFIENMFKEGKIPQNITITRSDEDLKRELIALKNLEERELFFDKAIISRNDKIVKLQNQLNFWEKQKLNNKKLEIQEINSAHCPFGGYLTWAELLC